MITGTVVVFIPPRFLDFNLKILDFDFNLKISRSFNLKIFIIIIIIIIIIVIIITVVVFVVIQYLFIYLFIYFFCFISHSSCFSRPIFHVPFELQENWETTVTLAVYSYK